MTILCYKIHSEELHWQCIPVFLTMQLLKSLLQVISHFESKMSQSIRGQGRHLVFLIGLKNTNLVKDAEILLPLKFRWIPFSGFRGEVENVSANQRPGWPSCFPLGPKNTNVVDDVEILLPVKFRWIPFSFFREEFENVSANQRPGRLSCLSDRPEKSANLVEGVEILLPVKFGWIPFNSIQWFQRRSKKCLSQSEAARGGGHLVFLIGLRNPNLVEGLRSCFLSSFVEFRH